MASAEEIERLLVRVEANAVQFEAQMKRVNKALHGSTGEVRRMRQEFKREMQALGRDVYMPVQAASAIALGAITAFAYNAAKRAEAVDGAFSHTFAAMPDKAASATKAIAGEFERLETDVKDNFTQMQSVMTALGVSAEQSLSMVDALQRRSLDIAAFRDVSDAEAFRAVLSGITGETEPLKRFGIVVNETAVKAELLSLGFKGNAAQASEAAKVIARHNIIMRQSAQMHGQVAREADTLSEQEKRARTELVRAAETMGQRFLPMAAKLLKWTTDAVAAFASIPPATQDAALGLLALVAASGPIAAVIKGFQAIIAAAAAARIAIATVAGSSAASGAAGAAAGGAAAGSVARVAGVAGGLALGLGSFIEQPTRTPEIIQRNLDATRRLRPHDTRTLRSLEQELASARLRQELQDLAAGTGAHSPSADIANAPGDFGLSEAQKHGTGSAGGGGGRGSGRAEAERIAAARAALDLERAIAVARASGDEAAIRAAEEREQLANLVRQYQEAGYADARVEATAHLSLLNQATALAEEREALAVNLEKIKRAALESDERALEAQRLMTDQVMDRLGYEAQLARVTGQDGAIRDAERRLFIEERTLEILRLKLAASEAEARALAGGEYDTLTAAEDGRAVASSIVSVLRSDNVWEEAGRRFKDAAWDGVEDFLARAFGAMSSGGGGGGGGNWLSGLAGLLGLGRRASGGPVVAGRSYVVGEHRPEIFTPGVNGNILPSVRAATAAGIPSMAVSPTLKMTIDLTGANGEQAIAHAARTAAAEGARVAYAQAMRDGQRNFAATAARHHRLGTV